ncbi:hypothetical protein [Nitriliruptor alkaliphilus]|uniref:hypothetical protein n=1 Tax=Nitriliruptor alkaliphilus TaxID=427918 RepID=UPI0006970017|nr:hypothetical protein [Nitriliruptor alkaliphilus]
MNGPDLAVAGALREVAWRAASIEELHRAVGVERWRRRAVGRAVERLAGFGLTVRVAPGFWRWAATADTDARVVAVAASVGVTFGPLGEPPTDCPRCGHRLDLGAERGVLGDIGCEPCGLLV